MFGIGSVGLECDPILSPRLACHVVVGFRCSNVDVDDVASSCLVKIKRSSGGMDSSATMGAVAAATKRQGRPRIPAATIFSRDMVSASAKQIDFKRG